MQTLTELRTEIKNWSERQDISDGQIDNFINLVEQNYKKDFYLPPNEIKVTLTTDSTGRCLIPTDYLKAKHMHTTDANGNRKVVYRKPNEFVTELSSIQATNGTAYFEREEGQWFVFAPAAGEGVEFELTYYSLIPSLLDIEDTAPGSINFVLAVMPTVYLFGALTFLHMFTFNEERATYYGNLYQLAKDDLIDMQADAEMSGSSLHVVATLSDDGSVW